MEERAVNRSQRRRLPKAIRDIADNLDTVRCSDCNNNAEIVDHDGVYVLRILHDDTCPWLKRYEARHG